VLGISGRIAGANTVLNQFASVTPEARKRVRDTVSRLALQLLRHVKADKLSGQVLRNVTGTLRRSINQKVRDEQGAIIGSVGTNLSYARAHELGVDMHKAVQVRAHLRTITQAWGRPLATPRQVQVGPFSRNQHIHLPERSFLRSALDDMRPEIRQQLVDALRNLPWQ
jgi:phage gpG-like protein